MSICEGYNMSNPQLSRKEKKKIYSEIIKEIISLKKYATRKAVEDEELNAIECLVNLEVTIKEMEQRL